MKRKNINIKLGKDLSARILILKIFIIFTYVLLLMRLMYIQIYKGEYYSKLSQSNRVRIRRIDAPRGKIYDRNGVLLATNIAGYRLAYLNGRTYNDEILKDISKLVSLDKSSIEHRIKSGEIHRFTGENILIDDLEVEKAHRIMESLIDYPYLSVIPYSKRYYVYDDFAAQTLGYVKPITREEYEQLKDRGYTQRSIIGKNGIERKYDEILQGKDGYEYIEVNAYNRIVKNISNVEAVAGSNIYLTIDFKLQKYMMEIYKEKGKVGSFIAMNAKTGEIITILSSPEYSLNKLSSRFTNEQWNEIINDPKKPLLNRAVNSVYAPGSVFKVIPAMAFLEEGIDPDEEFFDPGYYKIGNYTYRSWRRWGHGYVDLNKSLMESANVYYYNLADKIGYEKILEVSENMGIGKLTGIDLIEERQGLLPSDQWKRNTLGERWYRGDTMNLTIGQGGLQVTSLQMLNLYAIFANSGISYRPFLAKKIIDNKGNTLRTESKLLTKYQGKREHFDLINKGLLSVVEGSTGTGRVLRTKDLRVAAKTGSAQNQGKATHAWVAGFFPYENPEVVFVAFVEEGGGGASVAAPIAKKFIDKYIELYR